MDDIHNKSTSSISFNASYYMLITHLYELTDFKNPNAIKINQNPLIIEKPLKNLLFVPINKINCVKHDVEL